MGLPGTMGVADSQNAQPTALCGVGLNRTRAGRAEGAIPMPG